MYKKIFILIVVFILLSVRFCPYLYAQNNLFNSNGNILTEFIPIENEPEENWLEVNEFDIDEAGAPMPTEDIAEEKAIIDVVEVVGRIPSSGVALRVGPSLNAKILRHSTADERIIIIGEAGEWYKVIMYNNVEAYVHKDSVKTKLVSQYDGNQNSLISKTVALALNELIDKFNDTVKSSSYAEKYQIYPIFKIADMSSTKTDITLIFQYACSDLSGKIVPSYNENNIYKHMQQLLNLILGKLLLTSGQIFNIVIKVPDFDKNGNVLNFNKDYANVSLLRNSVDIEKVRINDIPLLSLSKVSMPINDLFKNYPK